jgi:hypothetical protein
MFETETAAIRLPPKERYSAAIWAEAVNSAAQSFLTDDLPPRPRPGDVPVMIGAA